MRFWRGLRWRPCTMSSTSAGFRTRRPTNMRMFAPNFRLQAFRAQRHVEHSALRLDLPVPTENTVRVASIEVTGVLR